MMILRHSVVQPLVCQEHSQVDYKIPKPRAVTLLTPQELLQLQHYLNWFVTLDGVVTAASGGITISGTATEVTAALVTAGSLVVASSADVTITDTGSVAATVLSAIGAKTGGDVTCSGALTITGTTAEITDALVTTNSKVLASSANVTFSDDPTAAQLAAINTAVGGTITLNDDSQTFSGTASDVAAAFAGGLANTKWSSNYTVSQELLRLQHYLALDPL